VRAGGGQPDARDLTGLTEFRSAEMSGGQTRVLNWLAAAERGHGASKMLQWYPEGL